MPHNAGRLADLPPRRRVLTVLAGATVAAALPTVSAGASLLEWRGRALGGRARLTLRDSGTANARRLIEHCVGEIERLENVFSLYRAGSELCRLNREGRLDAPSHDIRFLLAEARRFGQLSDGAFDVTVQALWRAYSRHFSKRAASGAPPQHEIARALALVDYTRIDLDNGRVQLAHPGMTVTLNGLAQGYITDRISYLLRDAGMTEVLVDLGEIRALDGAAWPVGIEDPRRPGEAAERISLRDAALATAAGQRSRFDLEGRHHHLFDPTSGRSAGHCLSATAQASTATAADALATALAVSPPDRAAVLVSRFGGTHARLLLADGRTREFCA